MKLRPFREYANWFRQGKFYVLSIFILLVTTLYLFNVINFFSEIVSASFALFGLFILLYQQVNDAQEYSGHKPNTFGNWVKAFPKTRHYVITAEAGLFVTSSLTARGSVHIAKDATIERKIEFLLQQIDEVQSAVDKVDDRVTNLDTTLKKDIKALRDDLGNTNESINAIIAKHIVGDYDINFFAIIIAMCGTFIQIFSQ